MAIWDRFLPWRRLPKHSALTTPLADLDTRRDLVEANVRARTLQTREGLDAVAQWGLDADDWQYRKLTSGARFQRRDLSPLQHDRMLQVTWYLWEQNPFARRLVTLMTDLIIGDGVAVEAKDERIQEVIDRTWNHRVNQFTTRIREFHNFLSLTGELILPVTQNTISGRPVFGFIDPYQVNDVVPLDGNVLIPDVLVLKGQDGQPGQRLKIIRENPETSKLEGEVFYFAINKLPNSLRGRSDLLPLADWLDLYDQYLFAEVERLQLLSAFVWDYTIKGGTDKTIQAKLNTFPTPKPGSVFGHNENETLEARTPDLKASDRSEVATMLRKHIGGSMGFPMTYLGDTDSNNATIQGQNDVLMKTPAARQKEFRSLIDLMVRYAVEGATTKNPALFVDAAVEYKIRMPEIASKDISRASNALAQVVTANDTAITNKTTSRRAALVVQSAIMAQLGVEVDPNEIEEQIEAETDEAQEQADAIAAGVAARSAALRPAVGPNGNGNPPIPEDDDLDADEPGVLPPGTRREAVAEPFVFNMPAPVINVTVPERPAVERRRSVERDPATGLITAIVDSEERIES